MKKLKENNIEALITLLEQTIDYAKLKGHTGLIQETESKEKQFEGEIERWHKDLYR